MTPSRDPWPWRASDHDPTRPPPQRDPWAWLSTDDYTTTRWLTPHWIDWDGSDVVIEPPTDWNDRWILLEPIIRQEGLREALALLTPAELSAAAMLASGCSMNLTAELFGCTRQAIQKRISSARRRITVQRPDIAAQYIDGRAHPKRPKPRR